jgi:hypothetical protein
MKLFDIQKTTLFFIIYLREPLKSTLSLRVPTQKFEHNGVMTVMFFGSRK